ncbi:ROK family protein [Saliterribacillus persicus]|uniref:fructokinase n=1 Tax=Saliterribacillus persicus TaxID=930114 RepID=A0A368X5Q9_9BACI|nr:ROK family protein [Saliterribacillus persicus]RCW63352.1 fructokinase [Saliterribacillus persicus]
MREKLLGSIEAGGTKFVVAVADFDFNVKEITQFSTTTPEETLENVINFFKQFELASIGIGSFGPVDVNIESKTYGHVLNTPKANWSGFDFLGTLKRTFDIPMYFTTDVNASAYGEYIKGSARNANSVVYFTLGTGVGGGALQDGQFISGIAHAEMGHATVIAHPEDTYDGGCPFHSNHCFEGLAAGPTLEGRTGIKGEKLPRDHKVFDYISYYAGQIAFNTFVNMAPEKIVFGGSVLQESDMPKVRAYFKQFNNGYVATPDLEELIVRPSIENNGSATIGNFGLAVRALKE